MAPPRLRPLSGGRAVKAGGSRGASPVPPKAVAVSAVPPKAVCHLSRVAEGGGRLPRAAVGILP